MEEKPSKSVLANTGFYICDSKVLNLLPGKSNFGMNDLIRNLKNIMKSTLINFHPIRMKLLF